MKKDQLSANSDKTNPGRQNAGLNPGRTDQGESHGAGTARPGRTDQGRSDQGQGNVHPGQPQRTQDSSRGNTKPGFPQKEKTNYEGQKEGKNIPSQNRPANPTAKPGQTEKKPW